MVPNSRKAQTKNLLSCLHFLDKRSTFFKIPHTKPVQYSLETYEWVSKSSFTRTFRTKATNKFPKFGIHTKGNI